MKKLFLVLALGLTLATTAGAIVLNQSGVDIELFYEAPTENADGSPLQDLAKTTIYYTLSGSTQVIKAREIPADSKTGGYNVAATITAPVGPGQDKVVTVFATATDENGNESEPSQSASIRVDRLAPKPPS